MGKPIGRLGDVLRHGTSEVSVGLNLSKNALQGDAEPGAAAALPMPYLSAGSSKTRGEPGNRLFERAARVEDRASTSKSI